MRLLLLAICMIWACLMPRVALTGDTLVCGVADGYPPYQFQKADGTAQGIDVEIMELVAERMGKEVTFQQGPWDSVVTSLRLGRIDCISGMEINQTRQLMFDFTEPLYKRTVAVFTLSDNHDVQSLEDLEGHIITGDRRSYAELHLSQLGLVKKIRIHQPKSKDQAMQMLVQGKSLAIIAPKAVAYYLADKYNVELRMLADPDPGSPVGIAVEPDDYNLLRGIQMALDELELDGALEDIYKKWNLN